LYTARRYGEAGCRYIKFPGQRWLRFPVRGYTWKGAIMTAVDQDGNKVARYRLARFWGGAWRTTEITFHPDQRLTDELALVIAASLYWLNSHVHPGGGGLCAWSTLTPGAEGCTASRTCTRQRGNLLREAISQAIGGPRHQLILPTDLLTTDLDGHGRGWSRSPTTCLASRSNQRSRTAWAVLTATVTMPRRTHVA
jgi:hypothetical protein